MTHEEQYLALLADLLGKLFRRDWHGVSDAANDLRVLEAHIDALRLLKPAQLTRALQTVLSRISTQQRRRRPRRPQCSRSPATQRTTRKRSART